jgi:hypothetical protein
VQAVRENIKLHGKSFCESHIPQNMTPAVINPQAIVIIRKVEIGNATTAIPNTGRSARTAQMMDIKKMIKEGAVKGTGKYRALKRQIFH